MLTRSAFLLLMCGIPALAMADDEAKPKEVNRLDAIIIDLKDGRTQRNAASNNVRKLEAIAREEAVQQRQKAEAARLAAEQERKKAEKAREAAEQQRQQAEAALQQAKKQQELAERQRAEALEAAEKARAMAAAERKARQQAEAAREAALQELKKSKAEQTQAAPKKRGRRARRRNRIGELTEQVQSLGEQVEQLQKDIQDVKEILQRPQAGTRGNRFEDFAKQYNERIQQELTTLDERRRKAETEAEEKSRRENALRKRALEAQENRGGDIDVDESRSSRRRIEPLVEERRRQAGGSKTDKRGTQSIEGARRRLEARLREADAEARFVFDVLDKDRDGKLTLDEWSRSKRIRERFEKANINLPTPADLNLFLKAYPPYRIVPELRLPNRE